jgi:hypothetical protein
MDTLLKMEYFVEPIIVELSNEGRKIALLEPMG